MALEGQNELLRWLSWQWFANIKKINQLYVTVYFGPLIAKTIKLRVEVKKKWFVKGEVGELDYSEILWLFYLLFLFLSTDSWVQTASPDKIFVFHKIFNFDKLTELCETDKAILFTHLESTSVVPLQQNP